MDEKELLAGLNPEQIEVVQHDKGPCLVSACAGAGKTAAVVRRMAYLATVRGVNPARIFGTTFTRKAAGEMNTRIKKLLGDDTRVQVQTFHSFCRSVLVEEMPDFKRWRLDERDHYRDLLKKAAGYENLDWQKSDIEELVSYVELAKAGAHRPNSDGARELAYARYELDPSEYRNPELTLQVYELAERFRREAFLMTFADWMVEVFELFKVNEGARKRWASLYDYVMIDEAQDNSAVQMGIGEELSRDHRNIMLIGDSRQSIYAFRGAAPSFFNDFPKVWDARVISMFRNYRSGRLVIDAANRILADMETNDIADPMVAMRDTDSEIRITEFPSPELEAQHVVDSIRAMHADGARLNGMVVLYRVNSLSRAVEEELAEQKIPYRVLGSTCFYNRKEIANLLAYLRVAWRRGATMDDVRRSLFAPHRFLGKVFMGHVEQAGREKPESFQRLVERAFELSTRITNSQKVKATMWASLIDNLRRDIADGKEASNPGEMLQKIVDATNYNDWLRRDEGRESPENDRPANVAELIASARKFRNVGEFIDHTKTQIEKAKANSGEVAGDRVTLMSIHRSKGLEYPHVFLISCNYKVLPHFFAEDKEEEKRLFYVAVTRAMDTLNISAIHFESEDPRLAVYPSPFLNSLRSLSASESMPETEDSLPSGDWSSDSLNHIDDDDDDDDWMPGDGDLAD